jgi:hypothetical protein
MGPHSDVDLLIVKRAPSRREVTIAWATSFERDRIVEALSVTRNDY